MAEKTAAPGGHVCPWWFAYTFDNFFRRLVHRPSRLLGPYVSEGMIVLDVGCGMGHFSIGMARLVGPGGKVHAVDLQDRMLSVMTSRARRAGVADRIEPHLCAADALGLDLTADFALLFWMVHEVPDPARLFGEIRSLLRGGGRVLYAEPSFHVGGPLFEDMLAEGLGAGFALESRPSVLFSRAALLRRE